MGKPRKLAEGSVRDGDWQLSEYARVMGEEALERQRKASEKTPCCEKKTFKVRGGYRTIHRRGCEKWQPWMAEHMHRIEGNTKAEAYIESARRPTE